MSRIQAARRRKAKAPPECSRRDGVRVGGSGPAVFARSRWALVEQQLRTRENTGRTELRETGPTPRIRHAFGTVPEITNPPMSVGLTRSQPCAARDIKSGAAPSESRRPVACKLDQADTG